MKKSGGESRWRGFAALGVALVSAIAWGERVELKTANASCTFDTCGARVISYKALGGEELLWNDNPVQIRSDEWAHGGIPLCWPYFGRDGNGKFHGYAWKREFAVKEKAMATATFELKTPEATVTYRARLTDESLKLVVTTHNGSDKSFPLVVGFHPYYRVGERDRVTVVGVKDEPFLCDHAMDMVEKVKVEGESEGKVYRIVDPVLNRTISCYAENSDSVVVWNPGPDSECPGVFPKGEWRHWMCVEPRSGKPKPLTLAPNEDHTLSLEIRPRRGSVLQLRRNF